jgi:hypothetical protein
MKNIITADSGKLTVDCIGFFFTTAHTKKIMGSKRTGMSQ